jgi:septum formation protein
MFGSSPPSVRRHPVLVLASGSPRRRALLDLLGIPHVVHPASIEERPEPDESPLDFCRRAARDKAIHVAASMPDLPVLAADTVVAVDDDCLGKPTNVDDAAAMLRRLSGREHEVHTAMALVTKGGSHDLVDTATVRFRVLDDELIAWYVSTPEPMDKAGAYAVQERGGLLVESITGSPHTVVGLPIHRLPDLWAGAGLDFRTVLDVSRR